MNTASRAALLFCAAATFALLGRTLALAGHGFDFTDEGYYLAWLSGPDRFEISASQFGFAYRPLYLLVQGDIAALRRVNVLLSFALSWGLFALLLPAAGKRVWQATTAGAFATASLAGFGPWLLTPNYNTLALQGMLLTAIGLAAASRAQPYRFWPALAVGAGGVLVFLAKPTAAALLAPLAAAALFAAPYRRRHLIGAVLAAAALLLFASFAIDGSPLRFAQRLRQGGEVMRLLAGGYGLTDLLRLDDFDWPAREHAAFAAALCVAAATAFAASRARPGIVIAGLGAASAVAATAGWLALTPAAWPLSSAFVAMQLMAPCIVAIVLGLASRRPPGAVEPRAALLVAVLLLMPSAFAAGSNNNYWLVGSQAAVFWLAAAARWLGQRLESAAALRAALAIAAIVLLQASVLVGLAIRYPYRQPLPVDQQQVRIALGGGELSIAPEYATYLETLRHVAAKAGWRPDTPLLDWTGQSPGTLYALQARPLGTAWWAGGYDGSDALAAYLLGHLTCEDLTGAWVLWEPDGPRSLPLPLLATIGADPARDYRRAAEVLVPSGAGGYPQPRPQWLLIPVRPPAQALAACRIARQRSVN